MVPFIPKVFDQETTTNIFQFSLSVISQLRYTLFNFHFFKFYWSQVTLAFKDVIINWLKLENCFESYRYEHIHMQTDGPVLRLRIGLMISQYEYCHCVVILTLLPPNADEDLRAWKQSDKICSRIKSVNERSRCELYLHYSHYLHNSIATQIRVL